MKRIFFLFVLLVFSVPIFAKKHKVLSTPMCEKMLQQSASWQFTSKINNFTVSGIINFKKPDSYSGFAYIAGKIMYQAVNKKPFILGNLDDFKSICRDNNSSESSYMELAWSTGMINAESYLKGSKTCYIGRYYDNYINPNEKFSINFCLKPYKSSHHK